jgi:hypothetical protein
VGRRLRALAFGLLIVASGWSGIIEPPASMAAADADAAMGPTAYLDGKPISLASVSKYYCDDFDYPVIRCSTSQLVAGTRASLTLLLTGVDYVTIYDFTYYSGSWMNVSQDYNVLSLIGWNDKISSFRARNSETGRFFVDWLNSGSQWGFCCNTQQPSLGGYDNTFSSIQRT